MLGANQYILTWEHFSEIHEDSQHSFENLCRSLFRRKLCKENEILHSDPNHPGVEVAPVLEKDGDNLISFQAKYFDTRVGYSQIKKSVDQIIEHYAGSIDVVYLYCNKDIQTTSDTFIEIKKIMDNSGIDLCLITGETILDQVVDYPQLLSCYFGLDTIDDTWFEHNLQISLDTLGKRYNSSFNIDTSAQDAMSIFLREEEGITAINRKKEKAIAVLKDIQRSAESEYREFAYSLMQYIKGIPDISLDTILDSLNWEQKLKCDNVNIFNELERRENICQSKEKRSISEYEEYEKNRTIINQLLWICDELAFNKNEVALIKERVVLVTGKMGTGKSQLLACAAKRINQDKRPVLLLLGQTYLADVNVETQIISGLESLNNSETLESLLAAMDEKAFLIGKDAVVFIDAINESLNRWIWVTGLNRLIALFTQFKNIRLVISYRTGFEELTLSEKIIKDKKDGHIANIIHRGFSDSSLACIYEFVSKYGIIFSPDYYLQAEMSNPLFLTWFCQTYTGEEQSLTSLIDKVIIQADREASIESGYREPIGILRSLLFEILEQKGKQLLTKDVLLNLKVWSTYGVINKINYIKGIERFGIITSYVKNKKEIFYIGYNLLEDYLNASWIIDNISTKEEIKKYCKEEILKIDAKGNMSKTGNETIFIMVSVLYAIKYEEECFDIVDNVKDCWEKNQLIRLYFESFTWRSSYTSNDHFLELASKYQVNPKVIWDVYIENATKVHSEINAIGLSDLLKEYDLNFRDYIWTMEINSLTEKDRIVSLAYYLEEGNTLEEISDKQAFLLLIIFSWLLTSSNRVLRDRVSKAMIEILKQKFNLCIVLLKHFKTINDPYVIQRLYGIVFGAVMKRVANNNNKFFELAIWIYENIFLQKYIYPDILLRDYARLIIERYMYEYPDNIQKINKDKINPPYNSLSIPEVDELDFKDKKYSKEGVEQILHSMKINAAVNGRGMYGDFGRYVFQNAVNHFVGINLKDIYYYTIDYILDDLKYDTKYFGEYDIHKAGYDRYRAKKIERIGKKYQWIAMYNILARLSDNYNIKDVYGNNPEGIPYRGSWDIGVRDFDPTLNIRQKSLDDVPRVNPYEYIGKFLPYDASEMTIDVWLKEDDKLFQDFPQRLIYKDQFKKEWISLYLWQEYNKKPEGDHYSMHTPCGEQHIWTIATAFITKNSDLTIDKLVEYDFINKSNEDINNCYSLFSREFAWSSGYKAEFCEENEEKDVCGKVFSAAINIQWEKEYDASQEETTSFLIPTGEIIHAMNLYEKDTDGVYYWKNEVVAMDLSIIGHERGELIIRKDILDKYLSMNNMKLFWAIAGEKQYFLGEYNQKWQRKEGYYIYDKKDIKGNIFNADIEY